MLRVFLLFIMLVILRFSKEKIMALGGVVIGSMKVREVVRV